MTDVRTRLLLVAPALWPTWSIRTLLAVLPLLLYGRSLTYGLFGLDDQGYYFNQAIAGGSWRGLSGLWTSTAMSDYAPVSQLTVWLDCALAGQHWWFAHLQQILWFAVSAWGVQALVLRLTASRGLSLAVSVLYVLHPLGGESVLWLAERKNLVSYALTLWCVERYIAVVRDGAGRAATAGAWALGILAMLAKPHAVCLPFLLLAYELTLGAGNRPRRALRVAVPMLLMAIYVAIELSVLRSDLDRQYLGGSRGAAILLDGRILLRYLSMVALPQHLTIYYAASEHLQPLLDVAAWLAVLALALASLYPAPTRALVSFAWLFAGAALAPTLNLVPQLAPLADHYLLWALPALLLIPAVLLREACACGAPSAGGRVGGLVAVGCAVVLTLLSLARLPEFSSKQALFTAAVRHQPDSGINWAHYCNDLLEADGDQALAGRAALRALDCEDSGRVLAEDRAMVIVLAALERSRQGDRSGAAALVEREIARLGDQSGLIADSVRSQVALRSGDMARAIAILQPYFTPPMQEAAALLRQRCRSGAALPDDQPPLLGMSGRSGVNDTVDSGHQLDTLVRQLHSLAYAYLMSGDLEHAFDVAALGVNLSPSSSGVRILLIDIDRRLHLDAAAARLAGAQSP